MCIGKTTYLIRDSVRGHRLAAHGFCLFSNIPSLSPAPLLTLAYARSPQIIGSHATRFAGYEQHDSHELTATVLDFLHEDTNEVLKKPYIEKVRKGCEESRQNSNARPRRRRSGDGASDLDIETPEPPTAMQF